jgi:hypothetical protein
VTAAEDRKNGPNCTPTNPLKREQERVLKKRKIAAKEIVADIRAGLTNRELGDKYRLSKKGLWTIFIKLIKANLLHIQEFKGRFLSREGTVVRDGMRRYPRVYPPGTLLVDDLDDLRNEYRVLDISLAGIKVIGFETVVGDKKTFLCKIDDLEEDASSFTFQAECKWTGIQEEPSSPVAGFEITSISERDFEQLQKLLRSLACPMQRNRQASARFLLS